MVRLAVSLTLLVHLSSFCTLVYFATDLCLPLAFRWFFRSLRPAPFVSQRPARRHSQAETIFRTWVISQCSWAKMSAESVRSDVIFCWLLVKKKRWQSKVVATRERQLQMVSCLLRRTAVKSWKYDEWGINKRSEFGLRAGTKDFRASFYKGTDRAKAGTMVQYRPTRPFIDVFDKNLKHANYVDSFGLTYLHGVVEELMFELLDPENLLKEIVELFFVHHFVPQHGSRRTLTRPPSVLVYKKSTYKQTIGWTGIMVQMDVGTK